jgi:uncharacterized repeat protein (TIGR03806 family)
MRSWLVLLAVGCNSGTPSPSYDKISDYQLFTWKNGALTWSPGVVPYDLNTPLFSDYALKFRAVKLPAGMAAPYDASGPFQFPVGTIVIKNFAFPADQRAPTTAVKLVETRLLIKDKDGWNGFPFLWNDAQTDAVLSPAGSMPTIDFTGSDGTALEAHYLVPTEGQCKQCHDATGSFDVIGPKARELNRDFDYGGGVVENQLTHWAKTGLLGGAPADPTQAPKLPVWNDPSSGTVELRARAWLEANCAHCHNNNGLARTTGLFLDSAETDLSRVGICKTTIAAGPGTGGFLYDIVPGDPDHSIMVFRIESTQPGLMMPQIGRSLVHKEGVALIREWISSLSGACQ